MQRTERRSAQRLPVVIPVKIDGQPCAVQQLSPAGLLLKMETAPAVGSRVELELRYHADDRHDSMHCSGDVIRVDPQDDCFQVALRLHQPVF